VDARHAQRAPGRLRRSILPVVAAYGAWLATMALAVGVMYVWRSALLQLYVALQLNKYGIAAFNNTIVIVFLLAWLVMVVVTESWFRQAVEKGLLGRRFARLSLVLLALLAVGFLTEWVV
jgi:hypothetical protein